MNNTDKLENDVYIIPDGDIISNAYVYGLNNSIRRAKFPMAVDTDNLGEDITPGIENLAMSEAGAGHDNWLNGVVVQFDLTFSNKAWVEAERYHFFDFVSSQSTMHRITKFDLNRSYIKYVDPRMIAVMKELICVYNTNQEQLKRLGELDGKTNEYALLCEEQKELYLRILYSNPSGFLLTAGMVTNYRQLKTIYRQRKNHRLPEWRTFCKWVESLPMSYLITGKVSTKEAN